MLVLSRNQDTAINIGPDIKVKVLSIKRQAVKLGIDAPESVRVWRDELAPRPDQQQQGPASSQSSAGMRIVLVVEDDPGHATLIRKALCQQQGTMVTVAGTAQGALDALGAQVTNPEELIQPDLIMLDISMPELDGFEVCQRLKGDESTRRIPVIFLSALEEALDKVRAFQSGGADYVAKPFAGTVVRARVASPGAASIVSPSVARW